MKVGYLLIQLAGVALVAANDNESTVTVTKTGESPESTNVPGRFDHTTRVTTTTDWVNPSATGETASSKNDGSELNYNGGIAAMIAFGGLLLL